MSKDDSDAIPPIPKGSARQPTRRLETLTAKSPPVTDPLYLVHVTAAGWAAEILRSNVPQIEVRECDVFGRRLVYFFVARAAFRPRRGDMGSDDLTRFPVAFVVKPDHLGTPAQVYPFDTGAAAKGVYLNARQSGVFLEDFALQPSMEAVRRMMGWAFTTYDGYLRSEIASNLETDVPPHEFAARAYLRIARLAGAGANNPDWRSSAIEVAYDQHVTLKANAVLVVLPEQLLEGDVGGHTVRERLRALGVDYRTYTWTPGYSPDQHMDDVRRLAEQPLAPAP